MYVHMIVLNKKPQTKKNMFLEIGLQFLSYIHKKVGQKYSHFLCFVFQMFSHTSLNECWIPCLRR